MLASEDTWGNSARERGGLPLELAGLGARQENLGWWILHFHLGSSWLIDGSKAESECPVGCFIAFIPLSWCNTECLQLAKAKDFWKLRLLGLQGSTMVIKCCLLGKVHFSYFSVFLVLHLCIWEIGLCWQEVLLSRRYLTWPTGKFVWFYLLSRLQIFHL